MKFENLYFYFDTNSFYSVGFIHSSKMASGKILRASEIQEILENETNIVCDEEDSEDENESIIDDVTDDEFDAVDSDHEDSITRKVLYGKNGHVWHNSYFHSKQTRTSKKNLIVHLPSAKGKAYKQKNEKES